MPPKKTPPQQEENDMEQIKASLANIQQEIAKMATQQHQILTLIGQVEGLQQEINLLKGELNLKEKRIATLEKSMADSEQYSRIDDVIITGLKTKHRSYSRAAAKNVDASLVPTEQETETLESQVLQFFESRNILVQSHNISACHPLPRKETDTNVQQPPAIIIRFVNRKHKIELMRQGIKLQKTGVYLNEHLTKKNADIAKAARSLRKDDKIKATWTRNCKIFIRLNGATPEDEKVLVVREIGELEQYKRCPV
ncbi:hypothetical protein AAFF_G00112390 [Aldrovandia affinis]|uniref:Uncharacterized protein n=1 Tax=Aldrovandia affinis TaxID=143900 RepID=A0AAD7WBL3_9TELE|nr:hypothetical protein AAFF_G00112390 [Aldrovandia affinis]